MQTSSGRHGGLLRVLGVVFGVAAVIGGMVGQGILRTPGIVAANAGSAEWVMGLWLLGGIFVAISALAYVEMGTSVPCAGGPFDYVRRAFGPLAGVVTRAGRVSGVLFSSEEV